MNKNLATRDNIFNVEEHKNIINYCRKCPYFYGERDTPDTPPCGMIHNISENEYIYKLMSDKIENELHPDAKKSTLYRMYINCFSPADKPYFHTDTDESGLTFIYYANDEEWNVNNGGGTQFLIDGKLTTVPPIPNRMVMFDSRLLHCATSFRDYYKFSIATKYKLNNK